MEARQRAVGERRQGRGATEARQRAVGERRQGRGATGRRRGLTEEEVALSRREHGENRFRETARKGFLAHFLSNLNDPIIRILLCALGVNLLMTFRGGDLVETLGIAASVVLATLISTLSERGSEAAFRRLSEEEKREGVRVWRDGQLKELPTEELVVGDLIAVGTGEQIPADGWVTEGFLAVDQSALTGEHAEIEKRPSADGDRSPKGKSAVLRGCAVMSGEATVELFAVGEKTVLGGISEEIRMETRESPLKLRLGKLAKQISYLGYGAAILVAAAYLFNSFFIDSGFRTELILLKLRDMGYLLGHLLNALMLGLTVVVVAVPEGLPMMIAVVLSANIRRMVRDRVLVRKPVGIESAGSMNLLLTDKTGTLTEGHMTVHALITGDRSTYRSARALRRSSEALWEHYALSCLANTAAKRSGDQILGGNETERALLRSLGDAPDLRYSVVELQPFDSNKKTSEARVRRAGGALWRLVKGAPERLLPQVRYAYDQQGSAVPFAPLAYDFQKELHRRTSRGERIILLCEGECELTLLCAVSLSDPLRREAADSVRRLQSAGVGVVMITGDNPETAASIAEACGILCAERSLVLTGADLQELSDDALKECLGSLAVVARALPADKSRLVRVAQEQELVVGMTGDGINDAPALKRADVGFAMGTGTQVAKDAGDVIILDNNLASICRAVLYGRTIFKSIRKFITLQLTMNLCAVGVSMLGPFLGFDAPVTVVQMLWINLIMDTLGGLAFAGEPPREDYMREPPKRRDEPILNGYMIHEILLLGGFTVGLCMTFLLNPSISGHFRSHEGHLYLLTAFFALFIFTSVLNCFNARTDRLWLLSGLSRNRGFLAVMALVSAVQVAFIYLGGTVLRTLPLSPRELGITLLLSLLVLPAELIRKLLWRLFGGKGGY